MQDLLHALFGDGDSLTATAVSFLVLIVAISNVVGRLIPDDATGAMGVARKLAKILGLYVSNRITKHESVNSAAEKLTNRGLNP